MTRPLMIFAAGLGTRMGELTRERPKPLIEVAGRALVDQPLAFARAAGADPVVANVHWHAGKMRAHLAPHGVRIADESARLLETGGGLRAARPLLGASPVWTINADAAWSGPNPLATLDAAWRPGMEALLLLVPLDRAEGYRGAGDFALGPDGRLARGGPYVYTGAQLLETGDLDAIAGEVFSLNLLWDRMAARGGLFGAVHPGGWCDVGRPENLAAAARLLGGA